MLKARRLRLCVAVLLCLLFGLTPLYSHAGKKRKTSKRKSASKRVAQRKSAERARLEKNRLEWKERLDVVRAFLPNRCDVLGHLNMQAVFESSVGKHILSQEHDALWNRAEYGLGPYSVNINDVGHLLLAAPGWDNTIPPTSSEVVGVRQCVPIRTGLIHPFLATRAAVDQR